MSKKFKVLLVVAVLLGLMSLFDRAFTHNFEQQQGMREYISRTEF